MNITGSEHRSEPLFMYRNALSEVNWRVPEFSSHHQKAHGAAIWVAYVEMIIDLKCIIPFFEGNEFGLFSGHPRAFCW